MTFEPYQQHRLVGMLNHIIGDTPQERSSQQRIPSRSDHDERVVLRVGDAVDLALRKPWDHPCFNLEPLLLKYGFLLLEGAFQKGGGV